MCANASQCIDGTLNYVNNYLLDYGIADINITEDLNSLYVSDSTNWNILGYDRSPATGSITLPTAYINVIQEPPDYILSSKKDVNNVVQNVYVWSKTVDSTNKYYISTFMRTASGANYTQLNILGKEEINLAGYFYSGPKPILSVDGNNAYSLGTTNDFQNMQPVIIFYRQTPQTSGVMSVDGGINLQTIGIGNSIELSQNGKHLYMAGSSNQYATANLYVFTRNLATGVLTFSNSFLLNKSYITLKILFSPDSLTVYVVDTSSLPPLYSSIDKYSRNDSTGALTYVSSFSTGVDIRDAAISKNGKNIYTEGSSLSHYIVSANAIIFSDSVPLSQFGIQTKVGFLTYDSKFLYHPDLSNNIPYFSTDVCVSPVQITFNFVSENDPNSIYSINAVELGVVNGKKFFSQIGASSNNSIHVFWNGTYWFYNRGNGVTLYFNSTDSELPPSGLWQPASDLPPGPWIIAQGFTTGTLTYQVIQTPPFVAPVYVCVTGNSGYNNPSFNGQYYGYVGSNEWVHIGVSWQTVGSNSGIATFYDFSFPAYESTTGLTGFYETLDINYYGYPSPTVTLGAC